MSKPDPTIDARLLKSAQKEFLACGFEKASLKQICQNAGITTGALYKRYQGKEDLFCAVVAPTVADLNDFITKRTTVDEKLLSNRELVEAWEMGDAVMTAWYEFLYARKEGFLLLIGCSAGTRYANFQHDWVEVMTAKSYDYYWEAHKRGLARAKLSKTNLHILLTAFWATIYEPFIHGYTWAEIQEHSKTVCQLLNWHRALGFHTGK